MAGYGCQRIRFVARQLTRRVYIKLFKLFFLVAFKNWPSPTQTHTQVRSSLFALVQCAKAIATRNKWSLPFSFQIRKPTHVFVGVRTSVLWFSPVITGRAELVLYGKFHLQTVFLLLIHCTHSVYRPTHIHLPTHTHTWNVFCLVFGLFWTLFLVLFGLLPRSTWNQSLFSWHHV